jgi:hypothetical protein
MTRLLFFCKRVRPDVQTAVAFLTTRVNDYKKLSREMKYLCGTIDLVLTFKAGDTTIVKWWIDASFAVHPDTGGVMSLGLGGVYGMSTRQKLVMKSCVGEQCMDMRNFLITQENHARNSITYQESKSASSKRTRHINIQYFFATNRIAGKEVSVKYFPTGKRSLTSAPNICKDHYSGSSATLL